MSYEQDFLIVLPTDVQDAKNIAQRYAVKILMFQGNIVDLDEDDDMPSIFRITASIPSISYSIEYTDYAVAIALKSVIESWVSALPVRKKGAILSFILRNRMLLSGYVPEIFKFAPYAISTVAFVTAEERSIELGIILILLALSVSTFTTGIMGVFLQAIETRSIKMVPATYLNITRGDKSYIIKRKELENSNGYIFPVLGFVLSVLINILSSLIFSWFF